MKRFIQPNLFGGLSSAVQDRVMSPDRWISGSNVVICDPLGAANTTSSESGVVSTPFSVYRRKNYTATYSWGATPDFDGYPSRTTIATFESAEFPTETWNFTGTGVMDTAISEGDQCISLSAASSSTSTATGAVTSVSAASGSYLVVDTHWANKSNFSAGVIRVGNDASNYYEWDISVPAADGYNELRFTWATPDNTVGTVDPSALDYVYISITAGATADVLAVKFDNLRTQAYSALTGNIITTTPITALYFYEYTSSSSVDIYLAGDTLYYNTGTADGIIKSGLSTTYNMYFITFPNVTTPQYNVAYFVDGVNGVFTYDYNQSAGSRLSRVNTTNWRYICSHKGMIIVGRSSVNPMTFSPSDIYTSGSPTWDSANEVTIPTTVPGEHITGLYSMDDYLLITTNARIWEYWGTLSENLDVTLRRTGSSVGCYEQNCGCVVSGSLYFFNGFGIYNYKGGEATLVSGAIQDAFVVTTPSIDGHCSIAYYPERNVLLFSYYTTQSSATAYAILTFHLPTGRWGKIAGLSTGTNSPIGFAYGVSGTRNRFDFFGLKNGSYDPSESSTGEDITSTLRTAFNNCGYLGTKKHFDKVIFFINSVSSQSSPPDVTVTVYTDYNGSTAKQTATLTPSSGKIELLLSGCYGESISFNLSFTNASQVDKTNIGGYLLYYTDAEEN